MRFTVMTPTYNRAHTLGRVYENLCAQTFRDFEWVIVDDGSTDGTKDLVSSWKPPFPIRYFWKPNGGKHTAMNLGVSVAGGEFVLFADSDDRFTTNALERFDYRWRQIPDPSRFANLSCLCCKPDGSIIGQPYPAEYADAFTFADQVHYRSAERWGVNRTDCLREFPFPEGEPFVPESLVWNRLSRKYAARFFNEPLRIIYPSPDSLSRKMVKLRASSPKATLTYYRELAFLPGPVLLRLRGAINYCRFTIVSVMHRMNKVDRGGRRP
jgi:glycosyltransferase involved in cell wall biosynthesis